MGDKRMLIIPEELVKKIDENRGDLSNAEFVEFLIDSRLKDNKGKTKDQQYVTKEEILAFEQDIKSLLRRSLDFFVSYGLDLGRQSPRGELEGLDKKLHDLESELASEDNSKEAKIKWK